MKYFFAFLLLLFSLTTVFSQEEKVLKFTDCSDLKISADNFYQKITSIQYTGNLTEKELTATLTGIGKAPQLSPIGNLPNELPKASKFVLRRNKIILNKLEKIDTAYNLEQEGKSFYINGFNTINLGVLNNCRMCQVKAKIVVFELKIENKIFYMPVIKSIEKL